MVLSLQTNIASLDAQRSITKNTADHDASIERLSSGFRINKASDDAAGLAVSQRMSADNRGLQMAKRNASDGISMIQTAEGGLNEIGNILTRLRELSIQSASDTIGDKERDFLNREFSQLKDEVTRIAMTTEFAGNVLLAGDTEKFDQLTGRANNKPPWGLQVGKDYLAGIDGPAKAGQSESDINELGVKRHPVNVIDIRFDDMDATTGEQGLNLGDGQDNVKSSVASKEMAQKTIGVVDEAIHKVLGYRATLGSVQSRLNSTESQLSVQIENNAASISRIRDTDFAAETARMTQANILKQSSVAMLAQANAEPQMALRLIQ